MGDLIIPVLLLGGLFAVLFRRDPRRLAPGIVLLLLLGLAGTRLVVLLLNAVERFAKQETFVIVLVATAAFVVLLILGLGAFLIVNTWTMVRRERLSPAALVSGVLGLGVIGYVGALLFSIFRNSFELFVWLFLIGLPISYFAFTFTSYVVYAQVYAAWVKRRKPAHEAVIALGAGLRADGTVTKLLASRLDLAAEIFRKQGSRVLVVSGGQGSDEIRPEAEAMAQYLIEELPGGGLTAEEILIEAESTTTQENLQFSMEVLQRRNGLAGDANPAVRVVTNNFHAFRAATLLRRLGIRGHASGSPTAAYYWPSATVREFMALLRDHFRLNAVVTMLMLVPIIWRFISGLGS